MEIKKNRDIYEITCLFKSFSIRIKTNNIYKDILEDVEIRFDISNYELDRRLSNEKHKKNNCINQRWIKRENHERICLSKSKNT